MNNDSCESKVKIERKVNCKVKIGDGEGESESERGSEKKKRSIIRKNCNTPGPSTPHLVRLPAV